MNNEISKIKLSIKEKEQSDDASMLYLFYSLSSYLIFLTFVIAGRIHAVQTYIDNNLESLANV